MTASDGRNQSLFGKIKSILIGKPKNPEDKSVFHQMSLVALFAWVGLGADALSSSSYGPDQAFRVVAHYPFLGLFIGVATALTIYIIAASYSQIVEIFPGGGGGYVVASKLLSPTTGMISGCALLVDYILTISISIASGSDAIFSFFPAPWLRYKIYFSVFCIFLLIILNLRGVKESVTVLVPIFAIFLITHVFLIAYGCIFHGSNFTALAHSTAGDIKRSTMDLGVIGAIALFLKAYSMGAGTYTGLETVSNSMPILREPRVKTAKKTMNYMALSLTFMALGLMVVYLLFSVKPVDGKTLNAVAFESILGGWPAQWKSIFLFIALFSEAALLFVAAQGGYLAGPRVLSNMALDRWMPSRFTFLSDRLVTQHGILVMGVAALITLLVTKGSVDFLVILYSINVFITFCLSQLGMVRHWWMVRKEEKKWLKRLIVNGIGLVLCAFILVSVIITKFFEGGWFTLLITGLLICFSFWVKNQYAKVKKQLGRLETLVTAVEYSEKISEHSIKEYESIPAKYNKKDKTAVLMVNGYNGLGLHSLFSIQRLFGFDTFKNYVFVQIGIIDAGNFKSAEEVEHIREDIQKSVDGYGILMRQKNFYTATFTSVGLDVEDEILELTPKISEEFPNSVFFGGQLVFKDEGLIGKFKNNLLHNNIVFTVQEKLYNKGIPFVLLPIRV